MVVEKEKLVINLEGRYLITTADERTWKFDRPVIFLGEWCRIYDRKHIWMSMDAIVASPYGLGQGQKAKDYAEARAMEEELFPIICDSLNNYHCTKHDSRFWRIVLGHWLNRFVDIILNRVKTIKQCLHDNHISGTTGFSNEHYSLATLDSFESIWASNDDQWNNALYVRILNLLCVSGCPVEVINDDLSLGYRLRIKTIDYSLKRRVLRWGYRKYMWLSGLLAGLVTQILSRNSDAFIINSYLPKNENIKLHLALKQVPQFWTSPKLEISKKPDHHLRQRLTSGIKGKSNSTIFEIMCSLVFELLPVCYLEGYKELSDFVQHLPWPTNPKFIFTSNNFDTDEFFKLWTAQKVEAGFKYIVGQHGANYGTNLYIQNNTIEETTSDKFLTWGWTNGLHQHTPAFIFKTAGRETGSYNSNGGLLFIELPLEHRITTWDNTHVFTNYFADQLCFINKLKIPLRKNLTVRLHSQHKDFKWNEVGRWRNFDNEIKLDTGTIAIRKLVAQSRLVIHSYDSTGILETLSQNIPTLAFWQNGFDHLHENAKPYYQLLVDVGIVHLTPESAAAKVNEVWDNVEIWWEQFALQEARLKFCDRYARTSESQIATLISVLC